MFLIHIIAPTLHPYVDIMSAKFNIRIALPADLPFIYATWLESFRYDSNFGKSHRNNIFFEDYRKVVDLLLQISDIFVAVDQDDTNQIYAYLVRECPNTLHYVFTKGPFRRWGIAGALFEHAFGKRDYPVEYTHKTYTVIPIVDKFPDKFLFRGSKLLKSFEGDDNGQTQEKSI